jgi:hypothetical protein
MVCAAQPFSRSHDRSYVSVTFCINSIPERESYTFEYRRFVTDIASSKSTCSKTAEVPAHNARTRYRQALDHLVSHAASLQKTEQNHMIKVLSGKYRVWVGGPGGRLPGRAGSALPIPRCLFSLLCSVVCLLHTF